MNLISNSLKQTFEGGRISVAMRHEEQKAALLVTVLDTGIGMRAEDREIVK